jgi:hypothetical protein
VLAAPTPSRRRDENERHPIPTVVINSAGMTGMPPTDTKTGTKEPRPYRLLYRSIPVMPANSGRFGYLAIPVPVNALRLSRRLRLLLSIIVACKSYSPRLPVRGLSSSSRILPRTLVVLAPSASFLLLPLCCVMATKHHSHAS